MKKRIDGMENWSVENGVFVICPLEYLSEKLGISMDDISDKLGNIHGLITMPIYSKIKVEKKYLVTKEGEIIDKIELIPVRDNYKEKDYQVLRFLKSDELLEEEFIYSKKEKLKGINKMKDLNVHLKEIKEIKEEYKKNILNRKKNE